MNEAKKYKFQILGETYSIVSDESEADVNKAIALVESCSSEISNKLSDPKKTAILVALRLASTLVGFENRSQKLLGTLDGEIASK